MARLLARVSAHRGQWGLMALLGLAAVFVSATASPLATAIEDRGLRYEIERAPHTARDITLTQSTDQSVDVRRLRDEVASAIPGDLREVTEASWAYQFTRIAPQLNLSLTLTGDGVTTDPDGLPPRVTLHHQSGIDEAIDLVNGAMPASDPSGSVIEFIAEQEIADVFGIDIGEEYDLGEVTGRMSGLFTARDSVDPVWEHVPTAVTHQTMAAGCAAGPCPRALRAALITDQGAFDVLFANGMEAVTAPLAGVRTRLDANRLSADWAPAGAEAVARVQTEPLLGHMRVQTRLFELLEEFERQVAAVRAVVAVAVAGILAIFTGLLVLVARLTVSRRWDELRLLRARGASVAAATGWLGREALPAALLAAAGGWLLSRWAVGQPAVAPGPGLVPALLMALLVLLIAAGAALATRQRRIVAVSRHDLGQGSTSTTRLTVELLLLLLAALGLFLIQQRGLAPSGVDPYLSATPALLAVVAGLAALRAYPWPLRLLAVVAKRWRSAVAFLGMARATRAAPASSLALLVLVLAVTVGGFAGAVNAGLADARDESAVRAVGAHVRISVDGVAQLPDGVTETVRQVPDVETVAVARRGGVVREAPIRHDHGKPLPRRDMQGPRIVAIDVAAYQAVLSALGLDVSMPAELRTADPNDAEVPVLASPQVAARNDPSVQIGETDRSISVVGGVAGLPGPDRDETWVLVPRQAWPTVDVAEDANLRQVARVSGYELLVAGSNADPEQIRAAVAELTDAEVTVASLYGYRTELERAGFNPGLTTALAASAAAGVIGAVLAVGMVLALQAHARGRTLSLLRTMGLSGRQAHRLLLVELLPLSTVTVLAGAAAGVAMPVFFGTALGLDEFTGGAPLAFSLDATAGAVLAMAVLGLIAVGVSVETAVHRRLRLGGVLRVE